MAGSAFGPSRVAACVKSGVCGELGEWVSVSYRQALLQACRSLAPVSWHTEHIASVQHLLQLAQREAAPEEGGVAAVVVAAGAASVLLPGSPLSLRLVANAHIEHIEHIQHIGRAHVSCLPHMHMGCVHAGGADGVLSCLSSPDQGAQERRERLRLRGTQGERKGNAPIMPSRL
jgi:hypothetical protein